MLRVERNQRSVSIADGGGENNGGAGDRVNASVAYSVKNWKLSVK